MAIPFEGSNMRQSSLYFVNWWFDTMMIGGVSILTWAGLSMFYSGLDINAVLCFSLIANGFINFPHFSATVYRLYQSADNIRQFPVTAFILPFVIFGAVI